MPTSPGTTGTRPIAQPSPILPGGSPTEVQAQGRAASALNILKAELARLGRRVTADYQPTDGVKISTMRVQITSGRPGILVERTSPNSPTQPIRDALLRILARYGHSDVQVRVV